MSGTGSAIMRRRRYRATRSAQCSPVSSPQWWRGRQRSPAAVVVAAAGIAGVEPGRCQFQPRAALAARDGRNADGALLAHHAVEDDGAPASSLAGAAHAQIVQSIRVQSCFVHVAIRIARKGPAAPWRIGQGKNGSNVGRVD